MYMLMIFRVEVIIILRLSCTDEKLSSNVSDKWCIEKLTVTKYHKNFYASVRNDLKLPLRCTRNLTFSPMNIYHSCRDRAEAKSYLDMTLFYYLGEAPPLLV